MYRGGLGQTTEFSYRGGRPWSVSAMIDRTQFAAQGHAGGQPGALGELLADDTQRLQPKTVLWLTPETRLQLSPPGGGGYGDPFARDPQRVLDDVVNGYVSIEAAASDYGVVLNYLGGGDRLVRLPEHYAIDWDATSTLRSNRVK
jgi:N-methylhydantoinase B